MSDFWANVLGTPPQQPSTPQNPADTPWWQRPVTPVVPLQQSPQAQAPQQPAQQNAGQQVEASLQRTQWVRQATGNCPGCGSDNYIEVDRRQGPRCYDCGYPVVQSGSGVSLPSQSGAPATPARQIPGSKTNNFSFTITEHAHPQQ